MFGDLLVGEFGFVEADEVTVVIPQQTVDFGLGSELVPDFWDDVDVEVADELL